MVHGVSYILLQILIEYKWWRIYLFCSVEEIIMNEIKNWPFEIRLCKGVIVMLIFIDDENNVGFC